MNEYFPAQETIGEEEINAVNEVMKTGILSHYRGNASKYFMGGPKVKEFEKNFAEFTGSQYAIAVNSCTSALQICCGAIGLKPGDEVIVTPWSMSCSASAPMVYGATPVFADIEPDYFCLSLESVKEKTTDKTKAIIAVSLFGQSFDPRIIDFANLRGIVVIEDAAQSIGSVYDAGLSRDINIVHKARYMSYRGKKKYSATKPSGTLGHMGCYSFTQGKHITSGEGGIIITDDPHFNERCKLIRNHAEAVVYDNKTINLHGDILYTDLIGYNMRMTEIQAAILIEQLKKLDRFVKLRKANAGRLDKMFGRWPDIFETPTIRENCSHSYYAYAVNMRYAENAIKEFVDNLNKLLPGEKGRPDKTHFGLGYIRPLYHFPLFGKQDSLNTVEELHRRAIVTTIIGLPLSHEHFDIIENAIEKSVELITSGKSKTW